MADLRKPEDRLGVKDAVDDVHPNVGPIAASPPDDAARVAEVARLYERHKAEVFRLALRYGAGRRDFAEDVLQDVFFRLFEALGYQVRKLHRFYFDGLTKKELPRGAFRELTQREIVMLKHFTGHPSTKRQSADLPDDELDTEPVIEPDTDTVTGEPDTEQV